MALAALYLAGAGLIFLFIGFMLAMPPVTASQERASKVFGNLFAICMIAAPVLLVLAAIGSILGH